MTEITITNAGLKEALKERTQAMRERDSAKAKDADRRVKQASSGVQTSSKKDGKTFIRSANVVFTILGASLGIGMLLYGSPWDGDSVTRNASGIAIPISIGILGLLGIVQWGNGGLVAYVRGKDNRLSTSLTQVALWTIAISTTLLYFITLDWSSSEDIYNLSTTIGATWDKFPEEYLLLLGGPFAAAIIARMSIGSKVEQGRLQKVEANETKLRQVVTDDDGNGNLVDAQFLVFNLVALTAFTFGLVEHPDSLPSLSPILVGLTSVSALSYTASKAAEANQPVVRSVIRYLNEGAGIRPGDLVEVQGFNFVPPGAGSEEFLNRVAVKFNAIDVPPEVELDDDDRVLTPTNTSIRARVPETIQGGTEVSVSVITAAGAESRSRSIRVVANRAVITGLEPPAVRPGDTLRVRGRFFRSPRATQEAQAAVTFDETIVTASETTDDNVSVEVPATLKGAAVKVSVLSAGGVDSSDQVTLRLLRPAPPKRPLRRRRP